MLSSIKRKPSFDDSGSLTESLKKPNLEATVYKRKNPDSSTYSGPSFKKQVWEDPEELARIAPLKKELSLSICSFCLLLEDLFKKSFPNQDFSKQVSLLNRTFQLRSSKASCCEELNKITRALKLKFARLPMQSLPVIMQPECLNRFGETIYDMAERFKKIQDRIEIGFIPDEELLGEFSNDDQLFNTLLKKFGPQVYARAGNQLKNSNVFVKNILSCKPTLKQVHEILTSEQKNNLDFMLDAIQIFGGDILRFASDSLKSKPQFIRSVIDHLGCEAIWQLTHLDSGTYDAAHIQTRDVLLARIKSNKQIQLQNIKEWITSPINREALLNAMGFQSSNPTYYPKYLQPLLIEMPDDEEVFKIVMKSYPEAIECASEDLKETLEQELAASRNGDSEIELNPFGNLSL